MTYKKPAVTVIQEFLGLVPALSAVSLPSVAIGASYQLKDNDLLGTFSGSSQDYPYAGKNPGNIIDDSFPVEGEVYPITKKHVSAKLTNAIVEVSALSEGGVFSGVNLSDTSVAANFATAQAGDLIKIVPASGVVVVTAKTNGICLSATGQRNRLSAAVAGQFANVKIGDTVLVTGGDNVNAGSYAVISKSVDTLVFATDLNDGGGDSANVAFSISGSRGQMNEGVYKIKSVTSPTAVVLESPVLENETLVQYSVQRKVSSIPLTRLETLPGNGFIADKNNISLPASLTHGTLPVVSGSVVASYRALRIDLASKVKEYTGIADLNSVFGTDQIHPANPLAYQLSLMLNNTVTPVNGLGLDANAVVNEVLSFSAAHDVLATTEMYALNYLSHNPAIHQMAKAHVEGFSTPEKKKERIAFVNSKLITSVTVQDESTTSTETSGARIIVNTQVDGIYSTASVNVLNDVTADAFLFAKNGDTVVITGGTNAILGERTILSKADSNHVTLSGAPASGNSSDLQYYIVRHDGLESDGITFFDRAASFISDGIAAGHKLNVLSGSLKGQYLITAVLSEKSLSLAQVPGVVTLKEGINYSVSRDLDKSEQAAMVRDYSAALGTRRVLHVWSDIGEAPVGAITYDVPGYFMGGSVTAWVTGLPVQQGFTNLTLTGFLGIKHSSGYFTEDQLDTIAGGGTLVLAQDSEGAALYVRHQLTTDMSAIKFQELSVTKIMDYISKFFRTQMKKFIGTWNIVDTTLDEIKGNFTAAFKFLKEDTKITKIGGVVKSATLVSLAADESQIDTVRARVKVSLPIPLNNLVITVEA